MREGLLGCVSVIDVGMERLARRLAALKLCIFREFSWFSWVSIEKTHNVWVIGISRIRMYGRTFQLYATLHLQYKNVWAQYKM